VLLKRVVHLVVIYGFSRGGSLESLAGVVGLEVAPHVVPAAMEVLLKAVFTLAPVIGLTLVPGIELKGGAIRPFPFVFVADVVATNPGSLAVKNSLDSSAILSGSDGSEFTTVSTACITGAMPGLAIASPVLVL